MNKPVPRPSADDEIGPLDEHGQQIRSPEEAEAIARLTADPEYWAGIDEAMADIAAGRLYTSEDVAAHMANHK